MKVKVAMASIFSNENSISVSVLVSNLNVDSSLFPNYKSKYVVSDFLGPKPGALKP